MAACTDDGLPRPQSILIPKRLSDNYYSWDEHDGFRIYPLPASSSSSSPSVARFSARRSTTQPAHRRIPEHPDTDSGIELAGKCACRDPEPIRLSQAEAVRRFASGGGTMHQATGSGVSCVCNFDPTVEMARTVSVGRRTTPRLVLHGTGAAAVPLAGDGGGRAEATVEEVCASVDAGVCRGGEEGRASRVGSFVRRLFDSARHRYNKGPFRIQPPLPPPSPSELEAGPRGPKCPDRRRFRSPLRWTLAKVVSDLIFLACALTVTFLFVWPAVEQAPFPQSNYGYAPHAVSISREPVATGSNSNNVTYTTTTTVEIATLGTTDIPARLLEANPSDRPPVGGTLAAAHSSDMASSNGSVPQSPKGYFSHTPFHRTLHAEFRTRAFPALVLGCAFVFLVRILAEMFMALCFCIEPRKVCEDAPLEKESVSRSSSIKRKWNVWQGSWKCRTWNARWPKHPKFDGILAMFRAVLVLVVIVTCLLLARAKVGSANSAP